MPPARSRTICKSVRSLTLDTGPEAGSESILLPGASIRAADRPSAGGVDRNHDAAYRTRRLVPCPPETERPWPEGWTPWVPIVRTSSS